MYNNHTMADIYFLIGKPIVKRIPGHQFILAISSAVFDAMFYGPLAAKKQKKNANIDNNTEITETSDGNLDVKRQDSSSILGNDYARRKF